MPVCLRQILFLRLERGRISKIEMSEEEAEEIPAGNKVLSLLIPSSVMKIETLLHC